MGQFFEELKGKAREIVSDISPHDELLRAILLEMQLANKPFQSNYSEYSFNRNPIHVAKTWYLSASNTSTLIIGKPLQKIVLTDIFLTQNGTTVSCVLTGDKSTYNVFAQLGYTNKGYNFMQHPKLKFNESLKITTVGSNIITIPSEIIVFGYYEKEQKVL